jgi:hypothetical protein
LRLPIGDEDRIVEEEVKLNEVHQEEKSDDEGVWIEEAHENIVVDYSKVQ